MQKIPAPSKKTVEIILNHAPDFSRLYALGDERQVQRELNDFLSVVYATDFMVPFDWMTEFSANNAGLKDQAVLANADAGLVRRLLIANLRLDRFSDGHLEYLLRSGYVEAALNRLRVLLPTL